MPPDAESAIDCVVLLLERSTARRAKPVAWYGLGETRVNQSGSGIREMGCPSDLPRGIPTGPQAREADLKVLLAGPRGHGGEEAFVRMLLENGPPDILYTDAGSFHQSAPGAKCQVLGEIALNRIVRRGLGVPNAGFRSLCVTGEFDLAHLHGLPGRLSGRRLPVVMSEGSSLAVYLQDYLNWSDGRLSIGLRRARHVYRILGL